MKLRNLRTHIRGIAAAMIITLALMTTARADLPSQEDFDAAVTAFSEFSASAKDNLATLEDTNDGNDYEFEGDKNAVWKAGTLIQAASAEELAEDASEADKAMVAKAGELWTPEVSTLLFKTVYSGTSGFPEFIVNNLWIMLAAALVFIMHLGFATLESGLTQQKNTVNILFKNVFIISIGILSYYLMGFNTHYPSNWIVEGWLAFGGVVGVDPGTEVENLTSVYNPGYTIWTDFIFQGMFAATAATIVSGAVAERVKLSSFMIFATLLVAVGYTVVGSWHWGGGWLGNLETPFVDFAGSTVVHAFGGFAALGCVLVLGARKGKYTKSGIKPILGSSMPLATIGVFMLWLGWFGFNGGSVLSADPAGVSLVFVTTGLAAAAGALAAIATAWIFLKKPDLSMALNGVLAGLVGITAGADTIPPGWAAAVGLIAGVVVVFSIVAFDRLKIDDPVGAISVHGICGVWGTLAVGIWGSGSFTSQLIGTVAVSAAAFGFGFIGFTILKAIMGIRVSEEEEVEGLDVHEHGSPAYEGSVPAATASYGTNPA